MTINLTLPYPPPTNHLYASIVTGYKNGKPIIKRVPTTRNKKYKQAVVDLADSEGVEMMEGPLTVTFMVYRPRRVGDLDGVFKVILDALSGTAYIDDEQIDMIVAVRLEDKYDPRVELTIEPTDSGEG